MAECDDVKFRLQMKRGGRIYTGVGESLDGAMANVLSEVRTRLHADDMDVMLENIRGTVSVMADIESELGGFMDLLGKLKDL